MGLIAACLLLTGCYQSPFAQEMPRTPYQRYQLLRDEAAPVREMDSYGHERPALRARLAPQD